jgi:hypothetical protein
LIVGFRSVGGEISRVVDRGRKGGDVSIRILDQKLIILLQSKHNYNIIISVTVESIFGKCLQDPPNQDVHWVMTSLGRLLNRVNEQEDSKANA